MSFIFSAKRQEFNWPVRYRHLCALIRGLQNLESSRKETVLFFSLLRKEPKVAEGPRPSRLPGTVQIAGRYDVLDRFSGFHQVTGYEQTTISLSIDGNDLNRCELQA